MRIRIHRCRGSWGSLAVGLCAAGAIGVASGQLEAWGFYPAPKAAAPKAAAAPAAAPAKAAHPIDELLAKDNAGRDAVATPVLDDLPFLRRVTVDLIGRIPSTAEIDEFLALPAATRRAEWVERLTNDPRFVDRWTAFYADLLRIRSYTDGGPQFLAYVHQCLETGVPYDEMVRKLVSAQGRAGKTPEIGYILGDNADPMAMAGVTSQVFLGIRIACAECHDHPFDVWTREQFYGFAAFFGKTRRLESDLTNSIYTVEAEETVVLWPPADKAEEKERKPLKPAFPFTLDESDGPRGQIARLTALRAKPKTAAAADPNADLDDLLADADAKATKALATTKPEEFDVLGENEAQRSKLATAADLLGSSEWRSDLATRLTDPRNRFFSRNLVNRVWCELLGRGIISPVDDYSESNPPSHPETLDFLADEFVASGYDLKTVVKLIVASDAYQRAPLATEDAAARQAAEDAFTAGRVRRMLSESLYDSIVLAGHLFTHKHPAGANVRDDWRYERVAVEKKDATGKPTTPDLAAIGGANAPGMKGMNGAGMAGDMKKPAANPGYDLEGSIEVDFNAALAERPEVTVETMTAMSNEEIEAMEMAAQAKMSYLDRYVRVTFDDNPQYTTAFRMPTPAPPQHFLRVFGQPARDDLGDHRDEASSMRQALMMLNGRMTHEAARVGPLEPLHELVVGKKANLDEAIKFAYREILTRTPTAEEIAFAKEIVAGCETPLDGIADLRWALLNCNEFRFLP